MYICAFMIQRRIIFFVFFFFWSTNLLSQESPKLFSVDQIKKNIENLSTIAEEVINDFDKKGLVTIDYHELRKNIRKIIQEFVAYQKIRKEIENYTVFQKNKMMGIFIDSFVKAFLKDVEMTSLKTAFLLSEQPLLQPADQYIRHCLGFGAPIAIFILEKMNIGEEGLYYSGDLTSFSGDYTVKDPETGVLINIPIPLLIENKSGDHLHFRSALFSKLFGISNIVFVEEAMLKNDPRHLNAVVVHEIKHLMDHLHDPKYSSLLEKEKEQERLHKLYQKEKERFEIDDFQKLLKGSYFENIKKALVDSFKKLNIKYDQDAITIIIVQALAKFYRHSFLDDIESLLESFVSTHEKEAYITEAHFVKKVYGFSFPQYLKIIFTDIDGSCEIPFSLFYKGETIIIMLRVQGQLIPPYIEETLKSYYDAVLNY